MNFTRRYHDILTKPPLSPTPTSVLPDHPARAKVGGTPPKHAPDGVSIPNIDACEAAAPVVCAFSLDKSKIWGLQLAWTITLALAVKVGVDRADHFTHPRPHSSHLAYYLR